MRDQKSLIFFFPFHLFSCPVRSSPISTCLILFCHQLSNSVLSCPILSCPLPSWLILSCLFLSCPVIFCLVLPDLILSYCILLLSKLHITSLTCRSEWHEQHSDVCAQSFLHTQLYTDLRRWPGHSRPPCCAGHIPVAACSDLSDCISCLASTESRRNDPACCLGARTPPHLHIQTQTII